ncbi:MAG: bifunctional hydroxymethylpyrimidine kinase/phosphomethylpyrimidine kinase [Deltaproteobacteria bacterium]
MTENIPCALTIAGSDSGGGAGIQADIKTFGAFGVFGMSAITSATAQNTESVLGISDLNAEFVELQIDAVMSDIGADAVKTGMLSNGAIVLSVAKKIREYRIERLVVDPVMRAKGGSALLKSEAERVLIEHLLPLALIVTPNIPEAEAIAGIEIRTFSEMKEAARRIKSLGAGCVLVKGGHLDGNEAADVLFDGRNFYEFRAERIRTKNTHGTGCTYSAAICALLARGFSVPDAVGEAKKYVTCAIAASLELGRGHGPLNHFWKFWTEKTG